MSDKVVVNGDVITLLPTAGLATIIPVPVTMIVTSGSKLTSGNKDAALESDLSNITLAGVLYLKGAYVGGVGIVTLESWNKYSNVLKKNNKKVMINPVGAQGSYKLTVVTPAVLPGVPPTPDITVSYSGKFTITTPQYKLNG